MTEKAGFRVDEWLQRALTGRFGDHELVGIVAEQHAHIRVFRGSFDNAPIGMALVACDGRFLDVNESLCEIVGYPRDELLELTFQDITHPDDLEADLAYVRQMLDGAIERYSMEKRYIHASGGHVWSKLSVSLVFDDDGQPAFFISQIENISAAKEIERQLVDSEARFRTLVQSSPVGTFLTDVEGECLFVNDAWCEVAGLSAQEALGQGWRRALHSEDEAAVNREWDAAIAEGRPFELEYRFQRPGRDPAWLLGSAVAITDANGATTGYLGTTLDITERKRAAAEQEALQESVREAQRLESLGVLAGGIAHDFNNLLLVVLGNASLALGELDPDSSPYQLVGQIEIAAQRAAELTRQLLAYSGRCPSRVDTLDLNALVGEMGDLLKTVTHENARLRFDLADDLPSTKADPTQLRQVVMNLIVNASESLDGQEGTVTVTTRRAVVDGSLSSLPLGGEPLPRGDYVSLEVADTGYGMDEDTLRRMFDPFFTTKFAGRGLGLAALLGIVRSHNGSVQVTSAPGDGSTFTVLLPAATGEPETTGPEASHDTTWRGSGAVMVVDDDAAVRRVARLMLESAGLTVIEAEDGIVALHLFEEAPEGIVLVLLDLTMPHLGGEETVAQLRGRGATMPFLVSSGYTASDAADRFAGGDVAGFIQKPYRSHELLTAVRAALEHDRGARAE